MTGGGGGGIIWFTGIVGIPGPPNPGGGGGINPGGGVLYIPIDWRWHSHRRRHTHRRWHHTLRRTKSRRRWRGSSQSTRKLPLVRSLELHRRSSRAKNSRWSWRWPCADRQRVILPRLSSEQPLSVCSVSFSLSVLFERVLDRDGLVHEELTVHGFDGRVRGLEICV
jgi:hypothetical protein